MFCIFCKSEGRESLSEAEKILLQIVEGNSDIELSDEEEQGGVFEGEAEAEDSDSSEDEGEAGQVQAEEQEDAGCSSSSSSRRPLWSKTTMYTLTLYFHTNTLQFTENIFHLGGTVV